MLKEDDYFKKFINEVEKEKMNSQLLKIKDKENKKVERELSMMKKSIIPSNLKVVTETGKNKG